MTRSIKTLLVATIAALLGVAGTGLPAASAARDVTMPAGSITGVGARAGLTMTIDATTLTGRLGAATVDSGGTAVEIILDCVRTYSLVGVILTVPIVNQVGYASGVGSDGRRWFLYVNEGVAFDASTTAGPRVSHDTCGVGYVVGSGVPAISVVGERTTVWTAVG